MTSDAAPRILIIMGVSGCGKTTIGVDLAEHLRWEFKEGDDFHPAANVEKMHAGIPLDDADRRPWLAAIATWIDERRQQDNPAVISCSALKCAYRDFLRNGRPEVCFIYLRVSYDELRRRVQARHHKYMPASLLDSQLAALEEPTADEPQIVTVQADGTIEQVTAAVLDTLAGLGVQRAASGSLRT